MLCPELQGQLQGNTAGAGGRFAFGIAEPTWKDAAPMASIIGSLTNAVGSELQGDIVFQTRPLGDAGQTLQNRLAIKSGGQVQFWPMSAAPSNPEAGDIYFDSTLNKHRGFDGTNWNDLY